MGSIEQNHPEYKRDGFHTIEPVVSHNVFRQGPKPCVIGFAQGGISLAAEYNGVTDNNAKRIVFVQKPSVVGGSTNLVKATSSMQYTFKSSLDSPEEAAAKAGKK